MVTAVAVADGRAGEGECLRDAGLLAGIGSGKTQRRRLNRGGDRQANSALYSIVLSRLRWDTRSRTYVQRRITEGKTPREAIRCLKRYVACEIYHRIKPRPEPTTQPASAA